MKMTRLGRFMLCALLIAGCASTSREAFGQASPNSPLVQVSSRHARPAANSQPGAFDFYLLTLSWSPEFCATHSSSSECSSHPGFVVHGMWPQNNNGTFPENCSNAAGPANPQQYLNLIPTVSLIQHEWTTHGTCSGLAPDTYFTSIGTAFQAVKIPSAFVHVGQAETLAPSAIIGQFAAANPGWPQGSITLSCGNNYLTAVAVCLSKTLVPEACQNVHTCGATVVKITPQ
jgi:ribonuclease T2